MRKITYSLFTAILFIILTGCSNKVPIEEQVFEVLEEAYTLELPFVEQQEDIAALENEEKEIFEEISILTSDEMDEIQSLATEAIKGIEKREELIEIERKSMTESQEEFAKIENLIEEIEEEDIKKAVEQVIETMNDRYTTYDQLHKAYSTILELEKELYTLFMDAETEKAQVTDVIIELNESYEGIMELNDAFNEYTALYNEHKKTFYNTSELNVTFEES